MTDKMPCHISDGPQTPEDVPDWSPEDEDAAYQLAKDWGDFDEE